MLSFFPFHRKYLAKDPVIRKGSMTAKGGTRSNRPIIFIGLFLILISISAVGQEPLTVPRHSSFIQYNTAVNKAFANVRFRYNPCEGNDFYIVYDEGLNTRVTRELPTLPFSSGRTLLLKYTYTFRF